MQYIQKLIEDLSDEQLKQAHIGFTQWHKSAEFSTDISKELSRKIKEKSPFYSHRHVFDVILDEIVVRWLRLMATRG